MAERNPHNPVFSVIMPVYNQAAYVTEAVESVIAQDFSDWQLVIVDDGSTDGSGEIVDRLAQQDPRIVVVHQANAGPAAARNRAISIAAGTWLTFLDSDDLYRPETLANYAEFIQNTPEVQFLYGYTDRIERDGTISPGKGVFQDHPTGTGELFQRMFLPCQCLCFRRGLTEKAGLLDTQLSNFEDYDLYLRISLHCQLHPLGKVTGYRRRHESNISTQSGYSRMLEAAVLGRFAKRYPQAGLSAGLIDKRLGSLYYKAARQYFKERCYRQAIDAAAKARSLNAGGLKRKMIAFVSRLLLPIGRVDARKPVLE